MKILKYGLPMTSHTYLKRSWNDQLVRCFGQHSNHPTTQIISRSQKWSLNMVLGFAICWSMPPPEKKKKKKKKKKTLLKKPLKRVNFWKINHITRTKQNTNFSIQKTPCTFVAEATSRGSYSAASPALCSQLVDLPCFCKGPSRRRHPARARDWTMPKCTAIKGSPEGDPGKIHNPSKGQSRKS